MRKHAGLVLVYITCAINVAISQTDRAADSTIRTIAYKQALSFFQQNIGDQTGLYNGTLGTSYFYKFDDGDPYFDTLGTAKGTVWYDDMPYRDVTLHFDNYLNVVNVFVPKGRVQLHSELVDSFTFRGHFIVHIKDSSSHFSNGFYERLYNGRVVLLKKTVKTYQEQAGTDLKIYRYILTKTSFWLYKNNTYYAVQGKKDLLAILADKRDELGKYIKKNRLKFNKTEREASLTQTITYYDQLSR